jgi:F0F1-type ATP synthase delta subunit
MLNDEDINKLVKAFSEVFSTKQDFKNFEEKNQKDFSDLINSVDGYSKKADIYYQEMMMLSVKVDRHEKWLQQIADKLDLKLNY